ncbi:hypothetical protein GCM10009634_66260 [Saccharothrix xinjiangensis]
MLERARSFRSALADETTWQASLAKAIGFEVAQHVRNRLALALVLFFIPTWLAIVDAVIPSDSVDYHSKVVGGPLSVDANELATVSGAINAVTLIIGFMMFAAVRRSSAFDQRLVLAGHSRAVLLLAKLAGLVLVAAVVAAYAGFVMAFFWDPRQPGLMVLSLFTSGLTYGGLGIVLGLALSTELAGMFVIIMVSLVDVMVQNPVINPADAQAVVRFLPTYGSMQAGAAAGFTDRGAAGYACLGPAWLTAFSLIGLVAFHRRTRDHARYAPATAPSAAVTITTRADGSLVVTSLAGPVVLCTRLPQCPSGCEAPVVPPARARRTGADTAQDDVTLPPAGRVPPQHPVSTPPPSTRRARSSGTGVPIRGRARARTPVDGSALRRSALRRADRDAPAG